MNQEKIQMFVMSNQKNFEASKIPMITQWLEQLDDDKIMLASSLRYKDPTTALILSLFLGGLGVDRFFVGDIGIGVLKLLTGGCFGILTIIDWFLIMNRTRQKNFEIFESAINMKSTFAATDQNNVSVSKNRVEEIKKYKQLLDSQIITQEEYEAKKRELLK